LHLFGGFAQLEGAALFRNAIFARRFAHPIEVAMTLRFRKIKVYARQFLTEGPDMEIALNFAQARELLLRQGEALISMALSFLSEMLINI
jgi:hypothetical protein